MRNSWVPAAMVALLAASDAAAAFSGSTPAVLGAFLRSDAHYSVAQIGGLVSAVYLGRVVSSLPGGWWVDQVGAGRGIVVVPVAMAAAMVLAALAPLYVVLWAALFVAGLAWGMGTPVSNSGVALWFGQRRRGTAMGFKQTGVTLGNSASAAVLPVVAGLAGWQWGFGLAAAVAGGMAAAGFLLWRSPHRKEASPAQLGAPGGPVHGKQADAAHTSRDGSARTRGTPGLRVLWQDARTAFGNRRAVGLGGTASLLIFTQATVMSYLMLFLIDTVHISAVQAGLYLLVLNLGGICGRMAWGTLVDWLSPGRHAAAVAWVSVCDGALVLAFGAAAPHVHQAVLFVVVFLLGSTALGWNGLMMNLMSSALPGRHAGLGTGVGLTIGFAGAVVGAPLVGALVDATGAYAPGWILAAVSAIAAAVFAARTTRTAARNRVAGTGTSA